MSAKRALFTTPARPTKRRRAPQRTRKAPMRVPKYLLPETKQFVQTAALTSTTDYAYQFVPEAMTQGDSGAEFIGSKFRMKRMRFFYDFTQLTLTDAVRITVIIPKFPGTVNAPTSSVMPHNTNGVAVLFDRLLPDAQECLAGTFDIVGPVNVEMDNTGAVTVRNQIQIYVYSTGQGANLAPISTFRYCIWYTDA